MYCLGMQKNARVVICRRWCVVENVQARKDTGQSSAGMKAEIERLKLEIERVKRENAELRETDDKLKQSLEDAVRTTRPTPQPAPRGLR